MTIIVFVHYITLICYIKI